MAVIKSDLKGISPEKAEEKIKRCFDFMVSEAYYAGSDDMLDSVFLGKRKGSKFFLIHRPPRALSLFTTAFRGSIVTTKEGCEIRGHFCKRFIDYLVFALLTVIVFGFILELMSISKNVSNALIIIWSVLILWFLFPSKSIKRKYIDFLTRVAKGDDTIMNRH